MSKFSGTHDSNLLKTYRADYKAFLFATNKIKIRSFGLLNDPSQVLIAREIGSKNEPTTETTTSFLNDSSNAHQSQTISGKTEKLVNEKVNAFVRDLRQMNRTFSSKEELKSKVVD